jgi:peptidoglycan-associated lipoprotein
MTTRSARLFAFTVVTAVAIGSWSCQNKAKPSTVPETPSASAETQKPQTPAETPPPTAEPFPKQDIDKTPVVEPTIDELNRQGVLGTVYFAFNSNELDDASKATLQSNAVWLQAHAKYTVEIGGHCDDRGSIGYNVALGDRRATAVKDYLIGLGASASQLVAISYGEEKPVDPGHNEAAWAKNRRAEFTIKQ